ncbi:hypothetical protein CRE_15827 [Caenorhabditis remanei]|uniref:Uncharacterized protein n=1 Tax=Caenorhabditis remanei TaxID=31234 RepID=E3NR21_CAERE|nr:hypothetical protein CRE_15827 [Caenorhabditis remanei]
MKSDTKCSSDKESEKELVDHEMETKDLCEGQSVAASVFKKDMVIGVDRVPIKSINSIEFSVMNSDEMLRSGDTKDDGLQTSCTKHAHTKDNNGGVNREFTEASSQKNGNCDEEQKSERDQILCSISLTKTKKQSVQQKKVSDVISSFGDLKRDQKEHNVQKNNVNYDSMKSSMSSEDGDGKKKRNTVDQKAVDNVIDTSPGSMDSDNDNQLDSYQAWKKSVPKMFKSQVVPRPLKDPPVSTNQSTWSDTQFEPAKESPRPLKDPPDSWMEDVKWRRMQQEYRPRKDPPSPYCQHGHRNLLGCLQYTQFLPTPMSTVSS